MDPPSPADIDALVNQHCAAYASAVDAIDTNDEARYADLVTRYADANGVFRDSTRGEAMSKFDEIVRKSETARRIEWATTGRGCVEDLASLLCDIPDEAFTPEIKQVLELAIRAYNVMAHGGLQRMADAHDIFVKKANHCVARKQQIPEITVRLMAVLGSEVHRCVQTVRWTNARIAAAALLALVVGVALGYGIARAGSATPTYGFFS